MRPQAAEATPPRMVRVRGTAVSPLARGPIAGQTPERRAAPIRACIIASDTTARNRLASHLRGCHDLSLIGVFASPDAAETALVRLAVDLALVHADGPGPDCIREVRFLAPALNIVLCHAPSDAVSVFSALIAGATAYVTDTAPVEQLMEAIGHAAEGRLFLCRQAHWHALERLRLLASKPECRRLTKRQLEISLWLCSCAEKDIARCLDLSAQTVHGHGKAICRSLGVHGRKGLMDLLATAR
jgi:DNA-binding NarL/FixJ family response regulator